MGSLCNVYNSGLTSPIRSSYCQPNKKHGAACGGPDIWNGRKGSLLGFGLIASYQQLAHHNFGDILFLTLLIRISTINQFAIYRYFSTLLQ